MKLISIVYYAPNVELNKYEFRKDYTWFKTRSIAQIMIRF